MNQQVVLVGLATLTIWAVSLGIVYRLGRDRGEELEQLLGQ